MVMHYRRLRFCLFGLSFGDICSTGQMKKMKKKEEIDWYGYAKYLEAAIQKAIAELRLTAEPCSDIVRAACLVVESRNETLTEENFSIYSALSVLTTAHHQLLTIAGELSAARKERYRADGDRDSDSTLRVDTDRTEQTSENGEHSGVSSAGRDGERGDHSGPDSEERGSS